MRGNQRNFSGSFMRISGSDLALNNILDEIDSISGVQVLSRTDQACSAGELALQLSAHARNRIIEVARKLGLQVAGT